jgi:peptidoglycan hydrolase-like protein with peptidoglycan-binding domain
MNRAFQALLCLSIFLLLPFVATAQRQIPDSDQVRPAATRPPIFRPTRDQIAQVQTLLKGMSLYKGESDGRYNPETRTGIRAYQKNNGLRETGTLNRATLEKMGIELTETQRAIPVSPNSYAGTSTNNRASSGNTTSTRRYIFRANKQQITDAQNALKSAGMYNGESNGRLTDATRLALRRYQEANGIKVTGTLNPATLEKMGIALTENQKRGIAGSQ